MRAEAITTATMQYDVRLHSVEFTRGIIDVKPPLSEDVVLLLQGFASRIFGRASEIVEDDVVVGTKMRVAPLLITPVLADQESAFILSVNEAVRQVEQKRRSSYAV